MPNSMILAIIVPAACYYLKEYSIGVGFLCFQSTS